MHTAHLHDTLKTSADTCSPVFFILFFVFFLAHLHDTLKTSDDMLACRDFRGWKHKVHVEQLLVARELGLAAQRFCVSLCTVVLVQQVNEVQSSSSLHANLGPSSSAFLPSQYLYCRTRPRVRVQRGAALRLIYLLYLLLAAQSTCLVSICTVVLVKQVN